MDLEKTAKELRNAYYKKYRSEHKEQKKIQNQRYWEKKAKQLEAKL